jgi:FHS family Na+ dependent glucose MFS transporter 1
MFMLSLADSAVDVGGNTLLVWVHGRKVGPYMNALHFFFGVGASIAPIFVAQALAWSGGVDWAYWSIAILALLPAIWLLRLPSPSHPVTTHEISHAKFDTRLVVLIAVCFFLFVALEAGFAGWIFSYALAVGFGSETTAAVLNSVFWAAFTLARLASIPMATRFSPRTIVIADLVISAMGATVMLIGGQTAPAAVWIGAICLGVGSAALFPTMISFAETRMRITGQVTSIFLAGASLAGMTIPWLIGQLFVSVGPQALPWAMLICALAGLAVFAVANRASAQPSAS